MDYEKKYKDALERARNLYNSEETSAEVEITCENILPELKESEVGRIRKALIRFHKNTIEIDGIKGEDIIAWLEKQGEHKPFNYESANIQQKDFAPKVEPKFKVGDWITNGLANPEQIISIEDGMYYAHSSIDNDIVIGGDIESIDKEYHLWTIEDAKDGDVLVDVYGNIGVFQKKYEFDWISYFSLGRYGSFRYFELPHGNEKTYPATKEQRDILFKAMADAGYEFDFDKKELKKIE